MRINFRITALVAAIALALVRVHSIVGQILAWRTVSGSTPLQLISPLIDTVLLLPLPILLFMLYYTGATPDLSQRLRYAAMFATLFYGTLAVPALIAFVGQVQWNVTNISMAPGMTVAAKIVAWSRDGESSNLLWSAVGLVTEFAVLAFLVGLFTGKEPRSETNSSRQALLLDVAQVTAFAGALATAVILFQQVYAIVRIAGMGSSGWPGGISKTQMILHNAWSGVPTICWALVAWIVYRGLKTEPVTITEGSEAGPDLSENSQSLSE